MVTGKDEKLNRLIVAFESKNESTLWGRRYIIESLSFLTESPPDSKIKLLGKARYRDPSVPLLFEPIDSESGRGFV